MSLPFTTFPRAFFALILGLLLAQNPLAAQLNTHVQVDKITVVGNVKTRTGWVVRELEFAPGDSLPIEKMAEIFDRNSLRLMNTGLFNWAKFNLRNWRENNCVDVEITVEESHFWWPIPVFELADRNFNVWWRDFHRDIRRVNFGMNFYHFNLTGRADEATITAQLGYTEKAELLYSLPGINKKKTLGVDFGLLYTRQHEVNFGTRDSRPAFLFDPDNFMLKRFRVSLGLSWRPRLNTWYKFALERHENLISDTLAKDLNPDFFLHGTKSQIHWSAVSTFTRDRRDIRPYPLHGWLGQLELRQNGLFPGDDLHLTRITGELDKYVSFSKKWSFEAIGIARVSLPRRKVPFFNNQALGYFNNFVRGYDYYVADGLDFYLLRTGLHFNLLDKSVNLGKAMLMKEYRLLPVKAYLSLNNDLGYSTDPFYAADNPLSNRLLHGHGIGLDLVIYYTRVLQFEYTFNHLGEGGFYLRFKLDTN